MRKYSTVVGETLAVLSMPQIRETDQCMAGKVGKTFLEMFGGNYIFLSFDNVRIAIKIHKRSAVKLKM